MHFPDAEQIRLVQDNLSTHTPASLYAAFPAPEARRLAKRFEWHYTPKHGSWLDMAESELGVLSSQNDPFVMARNMRTLGRARREMGNEGICSETDVLITAGLTSKKASRLEERARGEYAILAGREGKASREVVGSLDTRLASIWVESNALRRPCFPNLLFIC